jgi:predicted nucleic acid binding AN1-type Zn finger protein
MHFLAKRYLWLVSCNMSYAYIAYSCNVACKRYGCAREELKTFDRFYWLFTSSVDSPVNAISLAKIN